MNLPFLAQGANAPQTFNAVGVVQQGYSTPALTQDATYQIIQPGNMGLILGMTMINASATPGIGAQTVRLEINNSIVLVDIPVLALCPQAGENGFISPAYPFFPLYKTITATGQDNIKLTVRSTAALPNLQAVFYYMPGSFPPVM